MRATEIGVHIKKLRAERPPLGGVARNFNYILLEYICVHTQ
jgi:hypothetical protein